MRLTNDDLIEEIQQLTTELGHTPSIAEYRKYGEHSATTFYDRFGSWNNAIKAAGYEPNEPQQKISKDKLIEEIQNVAHEIGEKPSVPQMNEHGEYWGSTYRNQFGSWNEALEAAGFEKQPRAKPIEEEALLTEIHRLAEELGKAPTFREMGSDGKYSPSTYLRKFGTWNNALEEAGFEKQVRRGSVGDEELLAEIVRLESVMGERPTANEMDEHGKYWTATYQRHFGSWSAAVERALGEE